MFFFTKNDTFSRILFNSPFDRIQCSFYNFYSYNQKLDHKYVSFYLEYKSFPLRLNTFENCHNVETIPQLTDASFKWFDNSNMTFDKWADQDGEDLVDTCGFLYTKTGEWKKGNCEISSVEGTLCKAASK